MIDRKSAKAEAQIAEMPLSRRGLVTAGTAAAAAAALFAASSKARAEGEHDHHNHGAAASSEPSGPRKKHTKLIESALECIKRSKICIAHCADLLSKGDTSIKECYRTVTATIPMCEALVTFAAADATRLKDLAKLCIDVCQDCANECKKHAKHHAECKECEVACAECIKDCKELTRA